MSIKNPTTYAEWYWAQQVEATATFADDKEKTIAPYLQGSLERVADLEGFPPEVAGMVRALGTRGNAGLAAIGEAIASHTSNASITAGFAPILRGLGFAANERFLGNRIDASTAALLFSRGLVTEDVFTTRMKGEGYDEYESEMFLRSRLPYPDITSLIQWARYTTNATDIFTKAQAKLNIADDEFAIWEWLTQIRLSVQDVQALTVRGYMDTQSAKMELIRNGYDERDAEAVLDLGWTLPNASVVIQDGLFKRLSDDNIREAIQTTGIHPDYAESYVNALMVKPNAEEMIRYMLRHDPNLGDLEMELRRIGIHPEYANVFKELAYPVPPIGDMITMAVREAFSPEIAGRFGQYDDYPADLTRYAAMNGISEDWAKRYWAAHWSLPSPQQGFEMLQRGIIDKAELHLLLRALDVMPYWRDRLIQLSYRPLTRVDVRRMYAIGVLDEQGIEKAYRDGGYDEANAKRLREFVVKDTLRAQSGMSVSKIISAYKTGLTTRQEAYSNILDMGLRPTNASNIMESADVQLSWQRTKDAIAAIGNQYKNDLITDEQARSQLSGLRLTSDKVTNLLARWQRDAEDAHKTLLTKADVVKMLASGIVTESRARTELGLLGYNAERTSMIIALTKAGK